MDTAKKKMTFAQKILATVGLGLFVGFMLSVMVPIANAPDQTILRDAWANPPSPELFGYSVYDVPPVQIEEKVGILDRMGRWVVGGLNAIGRVFTGSEEEAAPMYNGTSVGYGPGSADSLPAFPNCQGPGCGALQQYRKNGVRVLRVTNLNNTGTGSFQAAMALVEADSNKANKQLDVIVFDTAGSIQFNPTCSDGACSLWRGVYIMGQSAPGPVVFHRWDISPREESEDVVWRSIAHRGKVSPNQNCASNNCGSYSFRMKGRRSIADHISVSHGAQRMVQSIASGDSATGLWDSTEVVRFHTWSNIFLSYKGDKAGTFNSSDPPTMMMFNSAPRSNDMPTHIGLIHSVLFGNQNGNYRMPNTNGDTIFIHQNLILSGGGNQWSHASSGAKVQYTYNDFRALGNIWNAGPSTANYWPVAQDSANGCKWWGAQQDTSPSLCADAEFFYSKNHVGFHDNGSYGTTYGDTAATQNELWIGNPGDRIMGTYPGLGSTTDSTTPPITRRRTTGFPYNLPFGYDTLGPMSHTTFQTILDSAGAGWKIDSTGMPYMVRDTVDRRARNAIMDSATYLRPGDVNRDSFLLYFMPNYSLDVSPKCRDVDNGGAGDGMCDKWEELAYGDTSLVAASIRASGYSAIELAYAGGILNVDTIFGGTPDIPAFRGAEGMGKNALNTCRDSVINGSWNLKVWVVDPNTYTDSSDYGTMGLTDILYDSTSDNAYDIIILPQGGHLEVRDNSRTDRYQLEFWKDCVYMSGAPAQGDGPPVLMAPYGSDRTVRLRIGVDQEGTADFASDVVIRDVRIWGDSAGQTGSTPANAIREGQRIIVDHTELIQGPSNMEIAPTSTYLRDLSVTHNVIGPFHNWGLGETLLQTGVDATEDSFKNYTLARNYLVHNTHRTPAVNAVYLTGYDTNDQDHDRWEHVNNIVYDFGSMDRMMEIRGAARIDVIGNVFSEATDRNIGLNWQPIRTYLCEDARDYPADSAEMYPANIYHRSNIYYEAGVLQADSNRSLFYIPDPDPWYYNCGRGSALAPDSIFTTTRNANSDSITTVWSSYVVDDSLFDGSVRAQVGPRKLTCGGTFSDARAPVTTKLINYFKNATYLGVNSDDSTALGWNWLGRDTLVGGTVCPDTDGDGLPDAFETWSGVTAVDSVIGSYFAIEHYLNGDSAHLAQLLGSPGSPGLPPRPDTLPVWPGAVGKAATALQGIRDSVVDGLADFKVYYITSLADSGDGTARAVLEDSAKANDYNVIIPDTFGVVECDGTVSGREINIADIDNIYYAGQLGPGSGLDFRNCILTDLNNNNDHVWRNLRISGSALWDNDGRDPSERIGGRYGIWVRGGENHYFDHSVFRWNRYMQLNVGGDTATSCSNCILDGVTVANSMIYDADSIQGGGQTAQTLGWSTGGQIATNGTHSPVNQIVGYQTFTMNNGWRNPVGSGDSIFHINNICYNTQRDCGQWNLDFIVDVIGNVSKRGGYNQTGDGQTGSYHHVFDGKTARADTSIYAASLRNIRNGNDWTVSSDSLWRGSKRSLAMYNTTGPYTDGDTVPISWKRDTPLPQDYFSIPVHTPNDAWLDSTLAHVGPSRKVDSLGNWTYVTSTGANIRTFYDSLRIKEFIDSTAVELGNGQVPDTMMIGIGQGTPPADSNEVMRPGAPIGDFDGDGLPNAFEKLYQGSTDSTSLKPDSMTASGYLVWELYADGKNLAWPNTTPVTPVTPVFRTAKGHGAGALETCRSKPLKVIPITSLVGAGGAGTSDSAIRAIAPDSFNIIVYKTGGVLDDHINLTGNEECVWFAGQTAPGGGFAYNRFSLGSQLDINGQHNLRISYLNFWDDTTGLGISSGQDNVNISGCVDCMLDHLSIHGGVDGIIDIDPTSATDSIFNVTMQNIMWAHTYKTGSLMDQRPGDGVFDRFTLYRNFSADARQRRPDIIPEDTVGMIRVEMIENVHHNTMEADRFSRHNGRFEVDYLDNFISQRSGKSYTDIWVLHECEDFGNPPCTGLDNRYPDVLYSDGNTTRDASKTDYTMWRLQTGAAIPDSVKRTSRISASGWPAYNDAYNSGVTMDSAHAEFVIDSAGAWARLSCGGTFISNRNALDDTTAYKFTNAQGLATTPSAVTDFYPSDWPSLAAGTACTDTDGDGLPDAFETWSGITKADSTVANEPYLAIEYYLNGDSAYLAQLLGAQPPATNATWNNLHRVRNAGVTVTQRVIGTDTITLGIFPEPTDLPSGGLDGYSFIINSDTSESLVFSCDSTSGGAAIMDSAPADSNVNAWGYDPDEIRNRTISGCP